MAFYNTLSIIKHVSVRLKRIHKINASQIRGKLVKCPEKTFDYLFLCTKYQHMIMNALKHILYAIYAPKCNRQNDRMLHLLHMCNISGLLNVTCTSGYSHNIETNFKPPCIILHKTNYTGKVTHNYPSLSFFSPGF